MSSLRAERLPLVPLAALILLGCQAEESRPKLPRGPASLLEVDFRKTKLDETRLKPSFAEAFDFCESRPEGLPMERHSRRRSQRPYRKAEGQSWYATLARLGLVIP